MKKELFLWISIWLLIPILVFGGLPSQAEGDHPVELTVTVAPETQLETAGTVDSITFTIANRSDDSYTLYHAKLSGGFDNEERTLNEEIIIDPQSTREFTLHDVSVSEEQLDQDVTYFLTWDEQVTVPAETTDAETSKPDSDDDDVVKTEEPEPMAEDSAKITYVERSTEATVRIERFLPPELTVSVETPENAVASGETFTVTYHIFNDTKYDMSGVMLTDPAVYEGAIPIPGTELTAGSSVSVPIVYTMTDQDMVFQPVVSYIAVQRQSESVAKEAVTVGSVVVGIQIDVEQYPSNQEGTTFAITITNTGNRTMKQLQLYDEINTPIDNPFDLAAQQQKVLTFHVPSAYAAGLIRTVRFRVTGRDYFDNVFSYTDVNSYDCIPYITSDAVRLSLLASLTKAFYDDTGKLCGEILLEIRNYSEVRLTKASLNELSLFGTLQTYEELQRGETFYTSTFQLDGVSELSFRVTAYDPTGQVYATDTVPLNLEQLASLASRTENQTIIYHSNSFLKEITANIASALRNALLVVLFLLLIGGILCLALWGLEFHTLSKLPRDSMLALVLPNAQKTPASASMDQVLNSSPAEQLGYTAPTKLRYGATTVRSSKQKNKKIGSYQAIRAELSQKIRDEQWANPQAQAASSAQTEPVLQRQAPAPTLAAFIEEQKKRETGELQGEATPAFTPAAHPLSSEKTDSLTEPYLFETKMDPIPASDWNPNAELDRAPATADDAGGEGMDRSAAPDPASSAELQPEPESIRIAEAEDIDRMIPLSESCHAPVEKPADQKTTEPGDLYMPAQDPVAERSTLPEYTDGAESPISIQLNEQTYAQKQTDPSNPLMENLQNNSETCFEDSLQEIRIIEVHPREKQRKIRLHPILRVERKE